MTDLRFLTAGESHGPALLAILEGIPAGLPLSEDIINKELLKRMRGFGSGGRMTIENDQCDLLGGVMAGKTTGAPIGIKIDNQDHVNWKGKKVGARIIPRPGHVDLAGVIKYDYNDLRPGFERASARETAARVAVGAVCKQFLSFFDVRVGGYVLSIGSIEADVADIPYNLRVSQSEKNDVRCPDLKAVEKIHTEISGAIEEGETLGGVIEVICQNVPPGLGSHVQWDRKLDGRLAKGVMSIPAIKGVEIGPAFINTKKTGTVVQDPILFEKNQIKRERNNAGGLEGGITNGQPIVIRAAMKPIPTTRKPQMSVELVNMTPQTTNYERSDNCPVPRAVVVVEAMIGFVLAQAVLEKFGGDNLTEIESKFNNIVGHDSQDFQITPDKKEWWV